MAQYRAAMPFGEGEPKTLLPDSSAKAFVDGELTLASVCYGGPAK